MNKNIKSLNRVELVNMEFYAYHGCFKEEQIIGNKFIVTFSALTDTSKAEISDELVDALNYQALYGVIKNEVMITSKLLENVAARVLKAAYANFPQICEATVEISKLNPPIGGKVEASRVIITKVFENDK